MKTAKQLKIAQWELEALKKTRDFLAAEVKAKKRDGDEDRVKGALFNMNSASMTERYGRWEKSGYREYKCGTTCCIGGWMSLLDQTQGNLPKNHVYDGDVLANVDEYVLNERRRGDDVKETHAKVLHDLFYPFQVGHSNWDTIEPKHAVVAIENFLETGKVDWDKAMRLERVRPPVLSEIALAA